MSDIYTVDLNQKRKNPEVPEDYDFALLKSGDHLCSFPDFFTAQEIADKLNSVTIPTLGSV